MRFLLVWLLLPALAIADPSADRDAEIKIFREHAHRAWGNLHNALMVDGAWLPEQRNALNIAIIDAARASRSVWRAQMEPDPFAMLERLEEENIFHQLYVATTYGSEVFYRWSPEGVRKTVPKIAFGNFHVANGWRHLDHAVYFMTWEMAEHNLEHGTLANERELSLLWAAQKASIPGHYSNFTHALGHLKVAYDLWPNKEASNVDEHIAQAIENIEHARLTALQVQNILHGTACGPERHPCVIDGLDVYEFPGHAASWWSISPSRVHFSMPVQLNAAWNHLTEVFREELGSEHDPIIERIGKAYAHASRAWKFAMQAHYAIAPLVAKEHERH